MKHRVYSKASVCVSYEIKVLSNTRYQIRCQACIKYSTICHVENGGIDKRVCANAFQKVIESHFDGD